MADYQITFARSARKELENLDDQLADRIVQKITLLASNPRAAGATKLKGEQNLWRIRALAIIVLFTRSMIARAPSTSR